MVKKKVTKKKSKKQPVKRDDHVIKSLSENTIALQRVMTHLATKLDKLSNQISDLLKLFEESAKSLAEKEFDKETDKRDFKELVDKMEVLMDQNKTIAKGLTLFGEKENPSEKIRPMIQPTQQNQRQIRPIPQMNSQTMLQKSIMSQDNNDKQDENLAVPFPEQEMKEFEETEQFSPGYGEENNVQDINQYDKLVSTRPEKTINKNFQNLRS
jgi:hypothetical protein